MKISTSRLLYPSFLMLLLTCSLNAQQNERSRQQTNPAGPAQYVAGKADAATPDCVICEMAITTGVNGTYIFDARPAFSELTIPNGNPEKMPNKSVNFKKSEKINISIRNMNPFMYDYIVRVNRREVVDTAHLQFLAQLSPLLKAVIPTTENQATTNAIGAAAETTNRRGKLLPKGSPRVPATCPDSLKQNAGDAVQYLFDTQKELQKKLEGIESKAGFPSISAKYTQLKSDYTQARTKLFDPLADCNQLCDAAHRWDDAYQGEDSLGLDNQEQAVQDLILLANELKDNAQEFQATYSDLANSGKATCVPVVSGFDYAKVIIGYATAVIARGNALQARINEMRQNLTLFSKLKDAVKMVFDHKYLTLRQDLMVGGFDDPTTVNIVLERKARSLEADTKPNPPSQMASHDATGAGRLAFNQAAAGDDAGAGEKGNKDTADAQQPAQPQPLDEGTKTSEALNFGGGPRFTLSGGIVIAALKKREFQPVYGFARDPRGMATNGETLTTVIGEKENSQFRVTPILLLSTRLTNQRANNLHWSFGIGASDDNQGMKFEYFTGPSIDLLDKKLFLTIGPYVGKEQRLTGDAFLGGKPEGLAKGDTIPTQSNMRARIGFSFTYRIFPLGKKESPK
jgi:hypothetical protein